MSHMKGISDDSSIADQQDDVQTSPPSLAKTLPTNLDIHGVLVSKADPKKNELPGKPPNHLNEQELESEVYGALDLVAILSRYVDPEKPHEKLINITFRQVAFLSNVGGCSHHRRRTPEYVPKLEKIILKLSRGYRLDEIISEEKDLVFLRQLLELILDSEIISSSLDAKSVNASRPDAVLEALTAAPCHSRAIANLPAPISES